MNPAEGKVTVMLVLASCLGVTMVVLSVAILWAVVAGERDLSETGVRVLTVCVTATAGILGFEAGRKTRE